MELSKRLKLIASKINKNAIIADVGTDHAYLPVYLVNKGIISKAVAMDINKGPLNKAQKNINNFGYSDKIKTVLSNGLDKLDDSLVDTIIIAGMGGLLITDILERGTCKIQNVKRLVLQPQRDYESVRKQIHKIGYKIIDESILKEDNHFYIIITAEKGKEEVYSELEYKFGKLLIDKNDVTFKEYIAYKTKSLKILLKRLESNQTNNVKHRIIEVGEELNELKEVKYRCQ